MNPAQKHLLKTWIAAILWLGIIVSESSNFGSAEHTGQLLYPLLHFLFGLEPSHFPTWHAIIRKTGHFVGYFTLSWLLFRAWRDTFPYSGKNWAIQWARISFFMTALVACLDEWHQTFLPSRTGNLHDVLLDSTAALVAQIILFIILRRQTPGPLSQLKPREKDGRSNGKAAKRRKNKAQGASPG